MVGFYGTIDRSPGRPGRRALYHHKFPTEVRRLRGTASALFQADLHQTARRHDHPVVRVLSREYDLQQSYAKKSGWPFSKLISDGTGEAGPFDPCGLVVSCDRGMS